MKAISSILFSFLFAVTFISCEHMAGPTIKNFNSLGGESEKHLRIAPNVLAGLEETPALKKGATTEIMATFPYILMGEYSPLRIKWYFWAVSKETKKEFFGQALFTGPTDCSGYLRNIVVIDGLPHETEKTKGMVLSTDLKHAYDLAGNEFPLGEEFPRDLKYRTDFILKNGTPLKDLKRVSDFYDVLNRWNRYQSSEDVLLSPLGDDPVCLKRNEGKKENEQEECNLIKQLASENAQYTFMGKLIGTGRFAVSPDYVATAVGMGADVFRAANGSIDSVGLDYGSILSRRKAGLLIDYVYEMQQIACKQRYK